MTKREAEPISAEGLARNLVALAYGFNSVGVSFGLREAAKVIRAQAARIAELEAAANKMESEIDNLYRDMAYSRS